MNVEKKTIRSLLGIIFLDQTAITITFPLLTLIFFDSSTRLFNASTSFGVRSMWFGLCASMPTLINLFFAPFLSALSDKFGRKTILFIEIFSALFFTLLLALGVYWGELALIFIGFVVKGAFSRSNPTALAIIGDVVPKQKKILYVSYLQFAISLGALLGPILGGYFASRFLFAKFNFALPFFIAALIAFINTGFVLAFMRETLKTKTSTPALSFSKIKEVITEPNVLRISLILLLIQLCWSMYYQFIPPILKTIYHFDADQLGWFIGMIAFWLAVTTGVGINVLQRYFNVRQMLLIAIYLLLAGFLLTLCALNKFISGDSYLIWISAMPIAAGDVIAYSCLSALYSNVVAHSSQGKVMGVSFIVVGLAWSLTGFLGGLLMNISVVLPLVIAPISVVLSLFFMHANVGRKLELAYN